VEEREESDVELLTLWRAGDERAGNALVRRHFAALYRFFRNKVDESPKDLMQRTFLTCVEVLDRVPDDISFRTYLLGIARNKLLHHWRGQERQRRAMRTAASLDRDVPGSPSWAVALAQEQRLLLRALRRLPLDLQITLELFYWEELAVGEIARVVDIPAGTVKSRLHRARELLRESIVELAESEDLRRTTVEGLDGWVTSLQIALRTPPPDDDPLP
jgi:RNA polymerase sigma-70 factor (ECF subfamily)